MLGNCRLVRAEERIESVHSALNRLVFSKATKAIISFAVKRNEKTAALVTVSIKRDGDS